MVFSVSASGLAFPKTLSYIAARKQEFRARRERASTLNAHLIAAEARRAEQVPIPNSMDLYFHGLAWYNKGLTPENMAQARGFYERALSVDPDNVAALIGSAAADVRECANFFVVDRVTALAAAEAKLTKALSWFFAKNHRTGGVSSSRSRQGIGELSNDRSS